MSILEAEDDEHTRHYHVSLKMFPRPPILYTIHRRTVFVELFCHYWTLKVFSTFSLW